MKFKPIYIYGAIAIIAIAIFVIVEIQEKSDSSQTPVANDQTMPNDDVHNQLKKQGSTSPGKENVSEEYKKKLAELEQAVIENPKDTIALRKYADYLSASHKKLSPTMKKYCKLIQNVLTFDSHLQLSFSMSKNLINVERKTKKFYRMTHRTKWHIII